MSCRICNGNTNFRFEAKSWPLVKCETCGFLQVDKKPTEEELNAIYSKNYFTHNKYNDLKTLHKEYNRRLNLIKKYVDVHSSVLDFGCAAADFINFAKAEYQFTGFDYSKAAINKAIEDNPSLEGRLYAGDYRVLSGISNEFDAIVLWDVIEHLWNPIEIMAFLSQKLKSGGYIFISTPDSGSLMAKTSKKYWPFMTPPEHLSFFNTKSFCKLADIAGYEMIYNSSKGKWVNVGFIFYKIKRIFPYLIPNFVIKFFNKKYTSKLAVFVPTFDVKYIVFKKNN